MADGRRIALAGPALAAGAALLVAAVLLAGLAGCVSGRVLAGYPGYPFVRFDVPADADGTFFALQPVLAAEGFPLDFTSRADGLVVTRNGTLAGRPAFLNVVVGEGAGADASVWVAAWESRPAGARRIDPLQEEAWADLAALAARLSAAVGGGAPHGPASSPGG
ncbi:MAG: hypothetical protein RRA92_06910 [Gemmatimonadota bacterium]|nr:hypothetical protein [Gemmatimonadota bacterium]